LRIKRIHVHHPPCDQLKSRYNRLTTCSIAQPTLLEEKLPATACAKDDMYMMHAGTAVMTIGP
jgi:hypothetical protein